MTSEAASRVFTKTPHLNLNKYSFVGATSIVSYAPQTLLCRGTSCSRTRRTGETATNKDHQGLGEENALNWSGEAGNRRKHQRFAAKDWIFAACKGDSLRLGKVVDISRGGVAFQYVSFMEENRSPVKGPVDVEVFEKGSSWCLLKASCCVVYDFEVPLPGSMLENYQLRRCGVQFGKLSREQWSDLEYFIQDFRVGPL